MEIDTKKISKHEIIGLKAKIIDSKNKSNINCEGKIVDETKNTIRIGKKILFKNNIKIQLNIDGKEIIIDGKTILGNPEERIKSR